MYFLIKRVDDKKVLILNFFMVNLVNMTFCCLYFNRLYEGCI